MRSKRLNLAPLPRGGQRPGTSENGVTFPVPRPVPDRAMMTFAVDSTLLLHRSSCFGDFSDRVYFDRPSGGPPFGQPVPQSPCREAEIAQLSRRRRDIYSPTT